MPSPSGPEISPQSQPFTKEERIEQLNELDKSIAQLLRSAGLALKTLSASQSPPDQNTAQRKEVFESTSNSYISTLQKVDIHLRRSGAGLEEADVVTEHHPRRSASQTQTVNGILGRQNQEGDTGKLDVGWLNSRSGRVGRDMEAELWESARRFLEEKKGNIKVEEDTEMSC